VTALLLALGLFALARDIAGAAAVSAHAASARPGQRVKVAVLPFAFIDSSMEGQIRGESPGEELRTRLMTEHVRDALKRSGRYAVIDTAGHEDLIAKLSFNQDFYD
jgi:hypothetical protein